MSLRNISADAKVLGGLGILILALLFLLKPSPEDLSRQQVSAETVATAIEDGADHVTADDLAHMMVDGEPGLLLVDVRAPGDYADYHIEGSVNLPLPLLFSEEGLEQLQDASSVVLVSTGGTHAAQAWTVLRQLGVDHVVTLLGGLNYWMDVFTNPEAPPNVAADPEIATFEFRKAVGAHLFGGPQVEAAPKPKVKAAAPIKRHKKKGRADEGC